MIAVLKAMGIESDQEALQLAGCQGDSAGLLVPTIQECKALGIFTQRQALVYLGAPARCTCSSAPCDAVRFWGIAAMLTCIAQ